MIKIGYCEKNKTKHKLIKKVKINSRFCLVEKVCILEHAKTELLNKRKELILSVVMLTDLSCVIKPSIMTNPNIYSPLFSIILSVKV